jgi:hypothetical protein
LKVPTWLNSAADGRSRAKAWAGRAIESDALLRLELEGLADSAAVKSAALEIGDRVDNCFTIIQHRHLDAEGDMAGEFRPGP